MSDPLEISHEVKSALNKDKPVVALESSVIAQGLPSPFNVETALAMEEAVTLAGAVPATIGIIDGKVKVGLTKEEIEKLAAGNAAKISVKDIPYAVHRKLDGGTTVSATARIASIAGISVMATGGIGGVHRGFAETNDISADLWEFTRIPMITVCSGIKAVLDINATMEWLETHCVPVYGYGTDELPAFYSRKTGISIPKINNAEDFSEICNISIGAFGFRSSTILAVPIPEADEVDVSAEIEKAVSEAAKKGIKGKELTPYLLNRVSELTEGKSMAANIALLKNNAKVAAEIAIAITKEPDKRMGFAS